MQNHAKKVLSVGVYAHYRRLLHNIRLEEEKLLTNVHKFQFPDTKHTVLPPPHQSIGRIGAVRP